MTSIAAKVYNTLLLNGMKPEIEKILRKIQTVFVEINSTSQILTFHRIIEEVRVKNLEATQLFVDLSKTFHSIHRENMEQIFPSIWSPQRNCYYHNDAL